jgi:hypothetical protein
MIRWGLTASALVLAALCLWPGPNVNPPWRRFVDGRTLHGLGLDCVAQRMGLEMENETESLVTCLDGDVKGDRR